MLFISWEKRIKVSIYIGPFLFLLSKYLMCFHYLWRTLIAIPIHSFPTAMQFVSVLHNALQYLTIDFVLQIYEDSCICWNPCDEEVSNFVL